MNRNGSARVKAAASGPEMFTDVPDHVYDELVAMTGQKVLNFALWEETLADAVEQDEAIPAKEVDSEADRSLFDIDLYLEGGVYFELFSTTLYADPNDEPLLELENARQQMSALVGNGLWLDEVAVDEENQLVLILSQDYEPVIYCVAAGWSVDAWDELPE